MGIAFDGNPDMYLVDDETTLKNEQLFLKYLHQMGMSSQMGMDADLVTVPNAGIPVVLSTFISPKVIDTLFAPMSIAAIVGEEQMGDWTTERAIFSLVEPTGTTATYDDFSEDGTADSNVSFPSREPYLYQTNTKWGDLEVARAGLAKLDWIQRKHLASIMTLQRFQNKSYAYGIAGLKNYGLLNDPDLPAPVAASVNWNTATAEQIFEDIRTTLFKRIVKQSASNVDVSMSSKMTLCMSSINEVNLLKTNQYGLQVIDLLKKAFPGLTIQTAPEYTTDAGELVQLIVKDIGDGTETLKGYFPMKLFAWPIFKEGSTSKQKKVQGTYGTVIYRPFLITQMLVS